MDARTQELVMAAKGGLVLLADIMKTLKLHPRESETLLRLNEAILAFETTPAARDGGRMDVEESENA